MLLETGRVGLISGHAGMDLSARGQFVETIKSPPVQSVIFFGPCGCGKGTSCDLMRNRGWDIISMSAILSGDKIAQSYINAGQMAPDHYVIEAMVRRVHEFGNQRVFDGFPRTEDQAKAALSFLGDFIVIRFQISDEEVLRRASLRRVCESCRSPHTILDDKCRYCGGELILREDDKPEKVEGRLADYHKKTEPILKMPEYCERVFDIQAGEGHEVVQSQIVQSLIQASFLPD